MAVTLSDFRIQIVDSGLISSSELDAFVEGLQRNGEPVDTFGLARRLVQSKKLTAYQARAIYHGKGKALNLGNYVILNKLGEGGMGIVFQAEHRRMHRIVAIKVISPSGRRMPSSVRRFRREVRAAGLLEHPNIVTAYDADEVGGREFLVMQFVDGTSLSSLVKQRGPLPLPMAISCILQAARGLEYAHNRGVVHRDVKPANLLLDRDGTVKILDMGLVRLDPRLASGADAELTDTGEVMGTADYMAPEQSANMRICDARADIYSLGYTLWYLLTGRVAYPCENRIEKIVAHWEKPIPSLREARAEVSPALEAVFLRMVAKKPEGRYQSMNEVITDLERCRTSEAAADTFSPPAADDRELNTFLQALPELSLDRESKSSRRGAPASIRFPFSRDQLSKGDPTRDGNGRNTRGHRGGSSIGPSSGRVRKRSRPLRVSGLLLSFFALVVVAASIAGLGVVILDMASSPTITGSHRSLPSEPEPPSPELGGDWVSLLTGDDLSGWKTIGDAQWEVLDKRLVGTGQGGWLATRDCDFADFELSLKYRIHRGGHSGIFLRARHEGDVTEFLEIQIRDDADPQYQKSPADRTTCALVGISEPILPVDAPANTWHKVAVSLKGQDVQVWFDGKRVNVTDLADAGLQRPWIHRTKKGCVGLELAAGTVEFSDLWVRKMDARLPDHDRFSSSP